MKGKTYRSSLLSLLQRNFSQKSNNITNQGSSYDHPYSDERRKFIGDIFKAGVAVSAAGFISSCNKIIPTPVVKKTQPKIVIIGAGMAGLNCCYQLQKQGYASTIYEGSSRISGRIFTQQSSVAPSIYTEMGGEFIDSAHTDMLDLCREFNLSLLDTRSQHESSYARDSFYIDGQFYSEDQVIAAFQPYAAQITKDINALPAVMTYENHNAATVSFDNISISGYLDSIGMTGFLRKGIEAAYLTEYGMENTEQSSINFLFLFSPDTSKGFKMFGASNERYKVVGGNQTLTQAIYNQVKSQVNLEQKLVKIQKLNAGYNLYFFNGNGSTTQVKADIVVSAIPFTLMREVEMDADIPAWKMNAINNLGYGTNAKLILGFNERVWRKYMHSGYVFTDKILQTGWDGSWVQPGTAGSYTIYQGGNDGVALGVGTPALQATQFINQMETMWPGCKASFNGNVQRMQWPSYEFTKASYASYKVGQYSSIRGAEIKTVGRLYFAGEHCSLNFQGYMNGAAATGRVAAKAISESLDS